MFIVGAVVVLAIAAAAFAVAYREPPPLYDPLGPGTAPMVVSGLLGFFGFILLARAVFGMKTGQASQAMIFGLGTDADADYPLRPGLAAFCFAATGVYTAAIAIGIPFFWSTFAFLAVSGVAMANFRRNLSAWVLVASAVGAFAAEYLFRTVLLVDLP